MSSTSSSGPKGKRTAPLTLAALGVVYGDIGTSPLYTVRECFSEFTGLQPTPDNILGILSMITWALIIVVTLKYVLVVMRADNRGEGGVLALMALMTRRDDVKARRRRIFTMMGIAGAALFYGDCLLTPAISVMSAVEGMKGVTPAFEPLVVPISLAIIVALFAVQRFGTERVGRLFGPITLVWFVVLFVMGIGPIFETPQVLAALSPLKAVEFATRNGIVAFVALGSVTLAITGAEALYADMGHFGRRPIRIAWSIVVLPSLLMNYYGQGALLLADPSAIEHPFFRLAPGWSLLPMVILATMATVIASQATISGAFSMAQQATLLGLTPRIRIQHTSISEHGQIYVPAINWLQLIGVVLLVINFRSSSNLAAAYGIAVTGTMLITTLLVTAVAIRIWKWRWPVAGVVFGSFLVFDIALFSANTLKFLDGGWVPLALAAIIYAVMATWLKGRLALADRESDDALSIDHLIASITPGRLHRPQGVAVYLTAFPGAVPSSLLHNLKHNEVLHEHVVLLTIKVPQEPFVAPDARAEVKHLGKGIHQIVLHYGFMDQPDVPRDLGSLVDRGIPFDPMRTSYFIGRNTYVEARTPIMARWQERLFIGLAHFASSASDFFGLPSNRVVELGSRIEV
jgi:KUP system potassium uptake protein